MPPAKSRFADPRPVVEFDDQRRPRYVEGIATRKNAGTVTTVHVLAWDPDEHALASVALPMWLLRLKSGPIEFGTYVSGLDDHGVRLEVADLERYGPGVLFDVTAPSGEPRPPFRTVGRAWTSSARVAIPGCARSRPGSGPSPVGTPAALSSASAAC